MNEVLQMNEALQQEMAAEVELAERGTHFIAHVSINSSWEKLGRTIL